MKEFVGWTSSRLTVHLLNLKRPQLNKVVQVVTLNWELQSTETRKLQVMLSLLCVQTAT